MTERNIPDGWDALPFDECIDNSRIQRRQSIQQRDYRRAGRFPVVDQGSSLIAGYCDCDELVYEHPLPIILFGDHTRAIKFLDFPFATGADGTKLLRPAPGINALFFYYALLALQLPSRGYNRHFSLLREQVVLVPRSNREQEKIASIMREIESALHIQIALASQLGDLKTATTARLFREGLRGEPLKESKIGPIPESWKVVVCEELCEPITVGIVVTPAKYYVPAGVPCFRSFNVKPNRLATNDLVFISPSANELHSKSTLCNGDVVVVRTGYPGTACVVPPEFDGANCVDLLIARPREGIIVGGFLAGFLNSPEGKTQVAIQQGGLAQQHYNVGAFRRLLVPLAPVREQAEISEVLACLEQRIITAEQTIAILKTLFSCTLHELMTGAVQVKEFDVAEVTRA